MWRALVGSGVKLWIEQPKLPALQIVNGQYGRDGFHFVFLLRTLRMVNGLNPKWPWVEMPRSAAPVVRRAEVPQFPTCGGFTNQMAFFPPHRAVRRILQASLYWATRGEVSIG
jgi:hypothetical protein